MLVKGIVRGRLAELDEGSSFPDGTRVIITAVGEPPTQDLTEREREAILERMFSMNLPVGDWEDMEREILEGCSQCPPEEVT
jgi:hypothetical protein